MYKKFGISGTKQSEAHFNLFDIRQMDGETPQDFAERISNINATLARNAFTCSVGADLGRAAEKPLVADR